MECPTCKSTLYAMFKGPYSPVSCTQGHYWRKCFIHYKLFSSFKDNCNSLGKPDICICAKREEETEEAK